MQKQAKQCSLESFMAAAFKLDFKFLTRKMLHRTKDLTWPLSDHKQQTLLLLLSSNSSINNHFLDKVECMHSSSNNSSTRFNSNLSSNSSSNSSSNHSSNSSSNNKDRAREEERGLIPMFFQQLDLWESLARTISICLSTPDSIHRGGGTCVGIKTVPTDN